MGEAEILVVEDEADTLNLAKIILETEGYKIQTASDGQETFKTIDKRKPDLILLDLRLPDIDGYEICLKLKGRSETESIPIVMFSASGGESSKERALEAGADDFLGKPFTMAQLLDVVKRHLGER
jgi:DNA-binding response OmpR family regulator